MQFNREITRLLVGTLAAFGMITLAAAYWALFGPETLLLREDNPRLVEAEAAIERGAIYDRSDIMLAETRHDETGELQRIYHDPAFASVLGYFSLRYGVGGTEAAYDAILRGEDLPPDLGKTFSQNLLHRPQQGSHIRLTLDQQVQRQLAESMSSYRGGAIVIHTPSGEILGMLSLPTYDPNTLDENWDILTEAPGNPFFNRVLQGRYQPGSALQTPLMAAALLANIPMENSIEQASRSISVNHLRLGCAEEPPQSSLTLIEAYRYACPYPFTLLGNQLGEEIIQTILDTFRLQEIPILAGYTPEALTEPEINPNVGSNFLENLLGQGPLTVNPLSMAMMASAVVNEGNAPIPYTLSAVKRSSAADWELVENPAASLPYLTADAARRLQIMMQNNLVEGAASAAARPGLMIGGHAGLAYAGESTQSWFVGFLDLEDGNGIAVAVVLEETADTHTAAQIGGAALEAALRAVKRNRN